MALFLRYRGMPPSESLRNFKSILNEKLEKFTSEEAVSPLEKPLLSGLDPSPLSFLLGQIPKKTFQTRQHYKVKTPFSAHDTPPTSVAPKPAQKASRVQGPAHRLSADQEISFEFFKIHGQELPGDFHSYELVSAYRRLALVHHPDKGGQAEKFICLKEHYETLRKVVSTQPTAQG